MQFLADGEPKVHGMRRTAKKRTKTLSKLKKKRRFDSQIIINVTII